MQEIMPYFNNCKALITEFELFFKKTVKIFARLIFFLYLCTIFRALCAKVLIFRVFF